MTTTIRRRSFQRPLGRQYPRHEPEGSRSNRATKKDELCAEGLVRVGYFLRRHRWTSSSRRSPGKGLDMTPHGTAIPRSMSAAVA